MSAYAAVMRDNTSRGRPQLEGLSKVRPLESIILTKDSPYLVDDKYKAIVLKVLSDSNLQGDVRMRFHDLWKTYEELKRGVENPAGTAATYGNLANQLETRFKNNIDALGTSLGFEPPKFSDDDGSGS
jgi:hypothetical protein